MTGVIDAPRRQTGEATIFVPGRLDARGVALWTETAGMEPVAVAVERVIHDTFRNDQVIARSEDRASVMPGVTFHGKQLDVTRVVGVGKEGVTDFVQKVGDVGAACLIGDRLRVGLPMKRIACDKCNRGDVRGEPVNERADRGHSSNSQR